MEITFPKTFENNAEIALSLGRIAVGPIENPQILRYILSPNGNLMLVGSDTAEQYVRFHHVHIEGVFGFG